MRFDGEQPKASGRGRPLEIAASRHVLQSALGTPQETAALRRWMRDPTFSAPLGRVAGDPGEDRVKAYLDGFDRLLNHLFMVRDQGGHEVGMAIVQIDGTNRVAWLETMIGERGIDTQLILADVARALARWAFDELGLAKVSVQCAASNRRTSAWLAHRMTLEATLREELLLPDGRRETLLRYSILASEWDGVRRAYEARDAAGIPPVIPRRQR